MSNKSDNSAYAGVIAKQYGTNVAKVSRKVKRPYPTVLRWAKTYPELFKAVCIYTAEHQDD